MTASVRRSGSFSIKRLESSYGKIKVTKTMHEGLEKLWKDSAKAFLRAVLENQAFTNHTDTGMSRASLIPLARKIRLATKVMEGASIKHSSRKGAFDIDGNWHPDAIRDMAAGIAAGEEAFTLTTGTHKRMLFRFRFSIEVFQYLMNEHGMWNTTAFQTIAAGEEAFWAYYNANFDTYVKHKILPKNFKQLTSE